MKTCFPARKQNGENYTTLDEMMGLIGQEPHGSWLAGTNNMWHGGIHISETSAPGSVLKPDMAEAPVPLQCMAEGEVVAWRLNKDYQKSTCLGQPVQYTTTFVLVKSNCLPDKDKTQTQLDFYSLYMGLAPLSAFEKHKCMVAKKTVSKRKAGRYESSQNPGAPAHAPQAIGELVQGTRVLILKEATFLNKPVPAPAHSGATELQPFGLAQAFDKDGKLKDEQFWVTLLPEYMAAEGEQYAHLPLWMQKAVEQGTFDAVTKPATALKISAGDAIGFLGEDIAPAGMAKTSSSTYAHIEVLCADSRMPAFLDNPGKVTTGRKYIRVHPDAMLCTLSGDTFTRTTTPVKKDMHIILPVDKCNPKESGGRTYYQAGQSYWLSEDDVDLIEQYNLKELGFIALAEENTPDMSASLQEGWMKSGYRWLAEQLRPERGIQEQQMSTFYKGMIDKMDADKNGQLSERELFAALHHPEMGVRDIVSRMIVKHQSEWFGGSSHQKWTAFFQDYDVLRIGFAKKWLDDMEWMSKVEPFTSGKAVWHMHPVAFLDALNGSSCACDRDITLEEFQKFIVGVSTDTLNSYLTEMNNGFKKFGITTCREKAHFLAQVLHESGNFRFTKEINGERASYQPWFGRGLIQITLRANYEKYGEYIGEDVTSGDSARDKLTKFPHSVLSAFWYYDVSRKLGEFAKNDDFNKVTAVINGGFNGYNDRLSIFNSAVKSLGGEHLNKQCDNGTFSFETSSIYQSKIYSLAWGLWHDPSSHRSGTDKNSEEALKGYKRAKELLSSSPFPASTPHKKIYGIQYVNVLDYINQRIEVLQ
ncbi:glycoside hydrolase family 19 protein [Enterobacter sp. P82]|uniref:glycoside hydrolase family 19 protein n=1 Tax=Enterobacter sp. P82 TaxID=3123033 RepID=UPI00300CC404